MRWKPPSPREKKYFWRMGKILIDIFAVQKKICSAIRLAESKVFGWEACHGRTTDPQHHWGAETHLRRRGNQRRGGGEADEAPSHRRAAGHEERQARRHLHRARRAVSRARRGSRPGEDPPLPGHDAQSAHHLARPPV